MGGQQIADVDFGSLPARPFHPSPPAWEDRVFYFLLLDRFSDGREDGCRDNRGDPVTTGTTSMFWPEDAGDAVRTPEDAAQWRKAGRGWVGGTLAG